MGRSNRSSELSMSILPSHSFIYASISIIPTLSLSLFSPSVPCPFLPFSTFSFLLLDLPLSVYNPIHLFFPHSSLLNLPFTIPALPLSFFCCTSLPLCFHFFFVCHPLSIIHSFHVFLSLSSLTPLCLTISLPLLWL